MADWLKYFFGGASAKTDPTKNIPAEPLYAFPSQEDAAYALKQGLGYGSGNEPYIEGKRANIYDKPYVGGQNEVIDAPSFNTDLTQYKNLDELGKINTLQAQTALAVNRSAIAGLGYDPHQMHLQTKAGPLTHGGMYSPSMDKTWVNVGDRVPSSATHESVHRGLEKLRQASPEAKEIMKGLPDEESIVRYMMANQMGDPEKGSGSVADAQRQRALDKFKSASYYMSGGPMPDDISAEAKLRRLEEIAAEQRKNRRPGGPR